MKKQQGSALVTTACVVGVLAAIAIPLGYSYISAANGANAMEQTIKATYSNNENILAQYGQRVQEAAQVPGMARDDILKVTKEALVARNGEKGSQAMFLALREHNPTLDAKLYQQVQQIIEGGRTEFQNAQTRLIDQKRVYETALGSVWQGMWMRVAGYPKIDLAQYKPITTDHAEGAFKAGKETSPLKLRQD